MIASMHMYVNMSVCVNEYIHVCAYVCMYVYVNGVHVGREVGRYR